MAYKRNRAKRLVYERWYHATHRAEEKAYKEAYRASHRHEVAAGNRAYYRGRKALNVIKVEQLFGPPQKFVMLRGHIRG